MKIRKFEKNDLDLVLNIWYESCLDTYYFINKAHWDSIRENVKKKFLNSNIFVYEENKIIKGFILIDEGYIDELYVSKQFRSMGIGKKLLDFIKKTHNELTINIFQKNINGIRFYKNNGFEIVEENIEDSTLEKGYFMRWHK